jgi:hypothetical protein
MKGRHKHYTPCLTSPRHLGQRHPRQSLAHQRQGPVARRLDLIVDRLADVTTMERRPLLVEGKRLVANLAPKQQARESGAAPERFETESAVVPAVGRVQFGGTWVERTVLWSRQPPLSPSLPPRKAVFLSGRDAAPPGPACASSSGDPHG